MPASPTTASPAGCYRLQVRRVKRPLSRPLATGNGQVIRVRESVWVRVQPDGFASAPTGYGEAAPLPWFGTESVAATEAALLSLGPLLATQDITNTLDQLSTAAPCARWALECALLQARALAAPTARAANATKAEALHSCNNDTVTASGDGGNTRMIPLAALLPAIDVGALQGAINNGFNCFKVKIGLRPQQEEWPAVRQLLDRLAAPAAATNGYRLRLDANGSLSTGALRLWLQALEPYSRQVDFMEQPLPAGHEAQTAAAFADSPVAFALDESLTTLGRLRHIARQSPQAVLVVKPSLLGHFCDFIQWRGQAPNRGRRIVYSTALETGIGLHHALQLAALDPAPMQPAGFGTGSLFANDGLGTPPVGPCACIDIAAADHTATQQQMEAIWKQV